MKLGRVLTVAVGATAMLGMVAVGGSPTWAQDATPEADAAPTPRPVHIHSGSCEELGDVVQPLTDLTAPEGDRVGQTRRADLAETSYTNVPLTLDAILGADHAINAHLSSEEIGTYIACGNIGGVLNANGALIIGLREDSNSGYSGIAYLAPGGDGASTDVSIFIAPTQGGGGRDRADDAAADAAATPIAATAGEAVMAGEQVPVSLTNFAIAMPESLTAGPVTFAVTNDGQTTHSFEVEGAGLEEELETTLEPGQSAMLSVTLEPGTYEVYCPVGNHADRGMRLEVTVA